MRRKDREIAEIHDILTVLKKCQVLHLGMCQNNMPYVVPVNFGYVYENDTLEIYFHGACDGKKISILQNHPVICFEAECGLEIGGGEDACDWTAYYESVIGVGRAAVLTDADEKAKGLDAIMSHYGYSLEPHYEKNMLLRTSVCKICVDEITGKRHKRLNM